ncbi:MAG: tripartite tricarboxylate transporter substrate-binding protein [Proteobacteria bacterium]|nr:tripartite tricarboxylate transporter substrate-binding protein [Pseudomonadota bacterium]
MNAWLKRVGVPLCLALALSAAGPAVSAPFPERPVRLVVPFAPGATTDILARMLAEKLAERWKQPVIVENKAGAGSILGADFVAKSAPDGYTILFGSESLALLPQLQDMPFDWKTDLKRVSLVGALPILLLASGKRADIGSLKELIDVAKANPGKLNYGSPGNATVHHLTTEMFARAVGIQMTHIPYKGAGPAMTDLLAGTIDVMVGAETSAKAHIQAGRVKALTVFSRRRPWPPCATPICAAAWSRAALRRWAALRMISRNFSASSSTAGRRFCPASSSSSTEPVPRARGGTA